MSDIDPGVLAEIARQDHEEKQNEIAERLRFQTEFAQAALKSLMLVNGGAILAILTFLGNSKARYSVFPIKLAFVCFIAGIVLVLFAYICAYFSQGHFMNVNVYERSNVQHRMAGLVSPNDSSRFLTVGNRFLYGAIGSAVGSCISFGCGAFSALNGII
ncbi:MAG: hypothetical protein ACLGIM_20660 [Alphaproteobacteria bacterium]